MERKMQRISHVLGRLLLEFQPYWTPEKSNHKTQISFVSFSLELSVARSVTAVSSGACSECLYGGDCVWNKHTFTQGVGRLLIEHLLCVPKSLQMSPNHPSSPEAHRGSVFQGEWTDGHFTEYMNGVGRAVLPPVLSSDNCSVWKLQVFGGE